MTFTARKMYGETIELTALSNGGRVRTYAGSDGRVYYDPEDQDLAVVRDDEDIPWQLEPFLGDETRLYEVFFVPLKFNSAHERSVDVEPDWDEAVSIFEFSINGNVVDEDGDVGALLERCLNTYFPVRQVVYDDGSAILNVNGWRLLNPRLYGPMIEYDDDQSYHRTAFFKFWEIDWEATVDLPANLAARGLPVNRSILGLTIPAQ